VRTREREAGGAVVERRTGPVRRAVACLASLRVVRRHVVGVRGSLEVLEVAADAGVHGDVVVVVDVALDALQRRVRAGQREPGGAVVELGIGPVGRVVARLAGLRVVRRHVVRIGGPLEIFQVAANASRVRRGEIVVVVDVARRAGNGLVRAGQGEARVVVVKAGLGPRDRVMARLAGLGEIRRNVIRVRRSLEVLQMATDASRIRRGEIVVVVYVARRAGDGLVRAGEREASGAVVKASARPAGRVVARLAGRRVFGSRMRRIGGFLVIRVVAVVAARIRRAEIVVVVGMALGAGDGLVRAGQREAGGAVVEGGCCPAGRVMARLAGRRVFRSRVRRTGRFLVVRVVAVVASRIRRSEIEVVVDVALDARNRGMRARQREPGGAVVEVGCGRPASRVVAGLARGGLADLGMIRTVRVLVIRLVAGDAIRGSVDE